MIKTITVLTSILILWSLWGHFSSRVEQAEYEVLERTAHYEIRQYPEHIVAQTTVQGPYRDALNQGFTIVASYIFGGNSKKERIAMTAPVTQESEIGEKIAMTAPVLATIDGESHIISFVMPSSYTLESLPIPNDSRIEILPVPSKKVAVVRFNGWRSERRISRMKEKLLSALLDDSIKAGANIVYAGYNAPWTPPWMNRNEVMVEIID